MTEETQLILDRIKQHPGGATLAEMVAWTGARAVRNICR